MTDLNVGKLGQMKRDILDIVRVAQRNGASDMTAKEIQDIYEKHIKKGRMSDGYFAGRVSELVTDGHLLRSAKRQCRITMYPSSNTVYAPSVARAASAGAAISVSSADCY